MKYLLLFLFIPACDSALAEGRNDGPRSVLEIDHDIYGDECVYEGAFALADGTPVFGNPACCPVGTEMIGIHDSSVVCW